MKRVYHPDLNTFEDVPDNKVDEWAEAGWLKTQPKHVTIPAGTPKPGEGPGIAAVAVDVPVLEDTSSTTTSSGGSRGSRGGRSGGSRSGGSRASRGSASTATTTVADTTSTT